MNGSNFLLLSMYRRDPLLVSITVSKLIGPLVIAAVVFYFGKLSHMRYMSFF